MGPLEAIQDAFREGRVIFTRHFFDEMRADYLFFADVEVAVRESHAIRELGVDPFGDPKYEVSGPTTDGRTIGLVCVVQPPVVFITVYEIRRS